ncbi:uncharacterized protein BT62DRAFT_930421 [Guyanagaster necrorhizus]|uniref:CENP-C homolog n=1 Tax=Guyanagaster necrorhizus TaxID=856835 RepID=A0A9P7VXL7_9AGAR|nr:uncharacterized protein BT62DRAFT_930421 [Guyanagaster necrorhizus MCA 3950]KAG7448335.1 hypothetical protein BT62DRAFT_930421 [Guyanagaster necrorhizus MCA 3950]
MPSTPRRSSVGTSRRDKPHVPYRGDNPEVGKKTGVTVKRVTTRGDGFEPFEQLLQQADQRTPPAKKRGKKRRDSELEEDIVDEDGEQDMDLDDSPIHYISNSRKPATPSSSRRIGSSSRPVVRVSDVDFDEVPSPRNQSSRSNGRGRSRLSETVTAHDLMDEEPEHQNSGTVSNGDYDNFSQDDALSPRQTSFMEMDRDDGDEQQGDDLPVLTSAKKPKKGKQRVTLEEPEEDVEAGIAHELERLDREPQSDNDEDNEPSQEQVRVEKAKTKKKALSTSSRRLKENRSVSPEGVRRSQRRPCKPLQWWRLEKRVYGRITEGRILVPEVREIRRLAPEPIEPLGSKKRKRSTRSKSKAPVEYPDPNPEKGWDDETNTHCEVLTYPDGQPRLRRIACTARMVNVQQAGNSNWFFEKIFGDGNFMAAGQMLIPPRSRKDSKRSKDNTYIFYVMEGAINLRINETSMILCTGAMFMVPRGNTYFIENISERDAKLFFSQAREDTSFETPRISASGRSSSAGARGGGTLSAENSAPKRAASSKI